MDDQNKEIAKLKTEIDFERDINAGREDQLEQDIKHLRGVIDERGDLIVIAEQRKEIADLKSDLELFMNLSDKKEEWMQYYKERAEVAEASQQRLEKKLEATEQALADLIDWYAERQGDR